MDTTAETTEFADITADAKRRMFDLGMKIYGVAAIDRKDKAAREQGLGTCPQAALSATPDIVRAELGIPEENKVLVGLSLGYPLPDPELNRFHTPREAYEEKVKFYS